MIFKKPILKLLSFFLVTYFVIPQYSLASPACENFFQDKKAFFTPERKKKYLKIAITVPLAAVVSSFAWKKIDEDYFWPKAESKITSQILVESERNSALYDNLIQNDFRFRKIKLITLDPEVLKEDPRLTLEKQKRMLAYNLQQSYSNYYLKYRKVKPGQLTLKENLELFGEDPLFKHLNFFFENGIKQYEGTIVDPKYQGPLSDAQKNKLFQLTHELYTKYILIDLAFNKNNQQVLSESNIAKSILNDPYTQELLQLQQENKITNPELIYLLQEDAYNRYYMAIFETLNIVNLKSENGKYTNEPITLESLRAERLSSI